MMAQLRQLGVGGTLIFCALLICVSRIGPCGAPPRPPPAAVGQLALPAPDSLTSMDRSTWTRSGGQWLPSYLRANAAE